MTVSFRTNEQAISMACGDAGAQIAAIRADLAAWSADKPKAVRNALANLDGWLRIASGGGRTAYLSDWGTVDVLACTARAVETLRCAVDASGQR